MDGGAKQGIRDEDSAGVYFMSVEAFEGRPERPPAEAAPAEPDPAPELGNEDAPR